MEKIHVSACIVTYNNELQITNTIESILNNTKGVELKLYVVDNASSDKTKELIKEKYKNVIVKEMISNKGFGVAHNSIINELNSEFHIILNPDIIIRDDVITRMAIYMNEHQDVGLLSPNILNSNGTTQFLAKKDPTLRYLIANRVNSPIFESIKQEYTMQDMDISKPTDIEVATGCFMFLRTKVFRQVKGFDEKFFLYCEDSDISRRIRQITRVCFFPNVCVYHYWNRQSKSDARILFYHIKSVIYYLNKWNHISKIKQ